MIWLTWRQLRAQALATGGLVLVLVAVLVTTGVSMHHKVDRGPSAFDLLSSADRTLYYAGIVVVAVVPALVGAFWGAPLVARELEAGTQRLVWNQSVARTRWLATKVAVTTIVAAACVGALCLSVDWWAGPIDGATSQTRGGLPGRLTPVGFAMRGIVPIGYAVFGILLGVALGLVVRRTLPAMALTLAVFTLVQVAVPLWVRPQLAPAVDTTVSVTALPVDTTSLASDGTVTIGLSTGHPGDWVLDNQTVDAQGRATALPSWYATCVSPGDAGGGASGSSAVRAGSDDQCLARLSAEGYQQRLVYHPASQFWRLQVTETLVFLVVSAMLAVFCLWRIRRRDA